MLCLMLDTQTRPETNAGDTAFGPFPRLSATAIERAKERLGISDLTSLGAALGFKGRMTFWRARRGDYDISYAHAQRIARQLGMPLNDVFEGGSNA
jgi:hypothetical protein